MKPDWKDAPEWATYLTKDGEGYWRWHEVEPEYDSMGMIWHSWGLKQYASRPAKIKPSLERRPEE